jgi:FAD/FMN-containing dehydrogenase
MSVTAQLTSWAAAARDLRSAMRGKVIACGDEGYANARRAWNRAVDEHPALFAFCESTQDVQAAVRAARAHSLPLSVRGAGLDAMGRSLRPGGLVIDLSAMTGVQADATTATVAGGATATTVIAAAAESGAVPVTGWNGVVGMAGLTLAGGYGPLLSSHGLALDNLVGAEVVLADGRCVGASADENPDLFWALRGGGGDFGVVTSMKVRLHPQQPMLGGMILFPGSQAGAVLSRYAEVAASAGDDLTALLGLIGLPDGASPLLLAPAWSGEAALGGAVMTALQSLGTPIHAEVAPMSYQDLVRASDSRVASGLSHAVETRWTPHLTEEVISAILAAARERTSPNSAIILQHFRGAAARVPLEATAFGLRSEHFLVEIIASWSPEDADDGARHRRWAQGLSQALAPAALPGGYLPGLAPTGRERIAGSFGGNLARLLEVKRRYDPDRIFSATPLPA